MRLLLCALMLGWSSSLLAAVDCFSTMEKDAAFLRTHGIHSGTRFDLSPLTMAQLDPMRDQYQQIASRLVEAGPPLELRSTFATYATFWHFSKLAELIAKSPSDFRELAKLVNYSVVGMRGGIVLTIGDLIPKDGRDGHWDGALHVAGISAPRLAGYAQSHVRAADWVLRELPKKQAGDATLKEAQARVLVAPPIAPPLLWLGGDLDGKRVDLFTPLYQYPYGGQPKWDYGRWYDRKGVLEMWRAIYPPENLSAPGTDSTLGG